MTSASRSRPLKRLRLSETAPKRRDFYTDREREWDRQTETEWERGGWQISVTMCLTATFLSAFLPQRLWWSTHMKAKEAMHAAKTVNGTITDTKQLSPEAGVSGFDALPHFTFTMFTVNLNVPDMTSIENQKKTHSFYKHSCNSSINPVNISHLTNGLAH